MADEAGVETGVKIKPETIRPEKAEIKVYSSLREALGERLYEDLINNIVVEDRPYFSVRDPDYGLWEGTEAYGVVGKHFWEGKEDWDKEGKPPKGTHFKLFKHSTIKGRFYTALEHELESNLSILQIMDAKRVNSEATREGDWQWVEADHILLISRKSGKVFDVASLLPSNFVFRYIPSPDAPDENFYASHSGKYSTERPEDNYVQYHDLTTPEKILSLFHEVGHIMMENDEPDSARELMDFQEKRWPRTREESLRCRELLIAHERGASVRTLWLMRRLKREGIDLGISTKEARKAVNKWLAEYDKRYRLYPGEKGRRFTRRR